MKIKGKKIELKPAQESDRQKVYGWLCQSDVTASAMGPPVYPEQPVPTLDEFCSEYPLSFFNETGNGSGRVFLIIANGDEVGSVGYDLLDREKDRVVLDIWMKSETHCGQGYGSDALEALSGYLHKTFGIGTVIISPSARNARAIAAYKKAGFVFIKILNKKEQEDEFGISEYYDNVLMIKKM